MISQKGKFTKGTEFHFVVQSIDATLYLIQAVADYVDPTEESFIPAILSLLSRLPDHAFVSQTALLMVGMCVCGTIFITLTLQLTKNSPIFEISCKN